jgi:hypothetical protein
VVERVHEAIRRGHRWPECLEVVAKDLDCGPDAVLRQWRLCADRDAIRAAVAAKTGDPFAYVTRVLIPDPQARCLPGRTDCSSDADNLVKRLSDDTFAQPVARPMLTAIRG